MNLSLLQHKIETEILGTNELTKNKARELAKLLQEYADEPEPILESAKAEILNLNEILKIEDPLEVEVSYWYENKETEVHYRRALILKLNLKDFPIVREYEKIITREIVFKNETSGKTLKEI